MCGIAGLISSKISPHDRHTAVARMCTALAHRGPDDNVTSTQGDATLGMRRLAIFDPKHGQQPFVSPDRRYYLIFNGAIYNHRALRKELTTLGHTFTTECDTEVLLAALVQWRLDALPRLRGMFAFALWDFKNCTLLLARDPLGIKPLYYAHGPDQPFLFASELNALLASGHVSAEIDPTALAANLAYLGTPAPQTIYKNLRSLRPGEYALLENNTLTIHAHWSFSDLRPADRTTTHALTQVDFQAELRARLTDTIRAHLIADVPVGAFLSGGLDSAAIVALMREQTHAKLKTFSIAFAETAYSEETEAAATARHLGTEHTCRILTGEDLARDLPQILASLDQPTGDAINTYYASTLARTGGVTVALSGLGGDELFGGYPWFSTTPRLARYLPLWRLLPQNLRRPILSHLNAGTARQQKLADFLTHARDLHSLAALQRRNHSQTALTQILAEPPTLTLHPELPHLSAELSPDSDPREIISAWELRTYMADVLLRDSDTMSMSQSLELRVPFVDRPLLEWLWSQPASLKYNPQQPKTCLANALADLLPPALLTRRKRGFTLPMPLWMRTHLRPFLDETFAPSSTARSGHFNPLGISQLWEKFIAHPADQTNWPRLWSLAIAIHFINRPRPTTTP